MLTTAVSHARPDRTEVYLITCGPGTETYSIYGHSALRIFKPGLDSDIIYNWGVFDFETPNFVWKFAKGRLEYMLAEENFSRFLALYNHEKRYVIQQRIFLDSAETVKLEMLVNENLRPENRKYKYDFFYDDCSTRIRDLLEKSLSGKLIYPQEDGSKTTFRDLTDTYQEKYQWLKLGIDLIMGSPGERKATVRDKAFLPVEMQQVFSETLVQREGKLVPLLSSPETLLDFPAPALKSGFLTSPALAALIFMILIVVSTLTLKNKRFVNYIDILVFSLYSILAVMMIFFNFFTDHAQMRWNLNIIWLSPVLIVCLAALILGRSWTIWFRILFYLTAFFLVFQFLLPQEFNIAFIPMAVVIAFRASVRAKLSWNPFSRA
jgi:hypothetical protein